VVIISGAPGVGKTRIAGEVGAEAFQKGCLVLTGGCYDRDDTVPFVPFVEILEDALAQAPSPQVFREALGDDAAEIARLMPQLRRQFPDIPPALQISPEQSRRVLFKAVIDLLTRRAAIRPMVLLLEDLHWADEGTLSLLEHLARSVPKIPVIIIGTFRDHELKPAGSLANALGEMIRLHVLERISLHGLPENAVAEMIQALSGQEPPQALVTLIYSNTEGNPFFIEELFHHIVEQASLPIPMASFAALSTLRTLTCPKACVWSLDGGSHGSAIALRRPSVLRQ
jgi:predicted ATPase